MEINIMPLCKSFFCGRTTRDIELRYTQSQMAVAQVSLAVDTGYGDKKRSNFFNLTAFNKNAESMSKYVTKGTKIIVECQPQVESYTNREGTKITRDVHIVQNWEFAESKSAQQAQTQQPTQSQPAPAPQPTYQQPAPQPTYQQPVQQQAQPVQPQPQQNYQQAPAPQPQPTPQQQTNAQMQADINSQPFMSIPDGYDELPFI